MFYMYFYILLLALLRFILNSPILKCQNIFRTNLYVTC